MFSCPYSAAYLTLGWPVSSSHFMACCEKQLLGNVTLPSRDGHKAVLELLLQFLGMDVNLPRAQKFWERSCLLFRFLGIVCLGDEIFADEIVLVTRQKRSMIMLASSSTLHWL